MKRLLRIFSLWMAAMLSVSYASAQIKDGEATVTQGSTTTVAIGEAYQRTLRQATGVSYTWTTSGSAISIQSRTSTNCTIKGNTAGSAKLYYHCSYYIDGFYRTMDFYYDITIKSNTISVTRVDMSPSSATMKVGETLTLTATVTPDDATDKSVTWSSSDDKIATVDEDGTVTAVAEGEAVITVKTTDGGYTAECKVTVKDEASAVDGTSVISGVYPNPFIDWFIVEVAEDTDAVLYTLSGQVVWSGRLTAGENTVETGSLPDGVYMLRAGDATYKLICGRR